MLSEISSVDEQKCVTFRHIDQRFAPLGTFSDIVAIKISKKFYSQVVIYQLDRI
jgi:hypothetical protein